MTKHQALSTLVLEKITSGMVASEALDAVFGPGTFDKLAADVYEALQPGLKVYHPEMGEAKPTTRIDAHLCHYGKHYFLTSQIELKGRGVTFLKTLTPGDLTPKAQYKVGYHEYKVTQKALDTICEQHAVGYEMLLD